MLALSCERAEVRDGMRILDLGCGWGSLSLWLAERYPAALITAVSNSHRQREWIEAERDAPRPRPTSTSSPPTSTTSPPPRRFDRVLSIEMFEHMRNWRELLRRIFDLAAPRTDGASSTCSATGRLPYRFQWHLGRRALLHRRADAEPRPASPLPGRTSWSRPWVESRAPTTRGRFEPGWPGSTIAPTRRSSC